MAISTACPHCGNAYHLADTLLGKQVRCKNCQKAFLVQPTAEPEVTAEAADEGVQDRPHQPHTAPPRKKPVATPPEAKAEPRAARKARTAPREDAADDADADRPRRKQSAKPAATSPMLWWIIGGSGAAVVLIVVILVVVLNSGGSGPVTVGKGNPPGKPGGFVPQPGGAPPEKPPSPDSVIDAAALVRVHLVGDPRPYFNKTLTVRGIGTSARKSNDAAGTAYLLTGVSRMWDQKQVPCDVRLRFRKLSDAAKVEGPVTVRGRCDAFTFTSGEPQRWNLNLLDAELVQVGKE
ncbi:MAG TPA: hypothetical protein VEL76_12225 [Gemmataceae bacterium]|nr:hypothetical protein [Gemmataceae bacterium]